MKFRTGDAPSKDVLRALEDVRDVVAAVGRANRLDPGLADYVFVPLAQQVFNESKRLSPRCLEVAAECVTLLVAHGYKQLLMPKLGKELLILMSLLAGAGNAAGNQSPPDDLKVAAFRCISEVIRALTLSLDGSNVLEDQGTKNIVDQLVYLLLEAITDGQTEQVQLSASEVLLQIVRSIKSRVFLASLLPRTISSLTKALRPSTTARRTGKVLTAHLRLYRVLLDRCLSDRIVSEPADDAEKAALPESWLKATTAQVKNALVQVTKLRSNESPIVRRALEELCVMIIEQCRETLKDSLSAMLETLVILSAKPDGESARSTCRHLMIAYPEIADILRSSLVNWSRSLPRLMQGQDEQPKVMALQRLTASLNALSESGLAGMTIESEVLPALVTAIGYDMREDASSSRGITDGRGSVPQDISHAIQSRTSEFDNFIMDHQSQKDTKLQLQNLLSVLRESPELPKMIRYLSESVTDTEGTSSLASFWLAIQLLKSDSPSSLSIDDLLVADESEDRSLSRTSLLADLHANSLPLLASVFDADGRQHDWQLQALAMECVVLYAQTFSGDTYRPELVDTLYPVLSFLGSPNAILRSHAMTAVNKLALSCQYSSATEMIIDNVDYLVNSVAWKLDTYSLSPEAPQILQMMVYLCGAQLVPYLDDLIQSVFAALDSYHGYSEWVETLFKTLRAMVDVSIEQPMLAITEGNKGVDHEKSSILPSTPNDMLDDLEARKRRKLDFERSAEDAPTQAPRRPWTNDLDGPSFPKPTEPSEEEVDETNVDDENNENLSPMKPPEDEEKKLSKSHNLLLSIARSTVPHLASPSPRVRHLLLDLLKDISPLLGKDEDSFLPLINAIWPVIVPRLFAEQASEDSENIEEETAYNIRAAADTIAVLCTNAGDFMSSRIDEIFQQLMRLFRKTRAQVTITSPSASGHVNGDHSRRSADKIARATIQGTVSLQVVKQDNLGIVSREAEPTLMKQPVHQIRTSKSQILESLTGLLTAILQHVRLSLDAGDEIMQLLLPLMARGDSIRHALEVYNGDALWLWQLEAGTESETMQVEHSKPVLREALVSRGCALVDIR